MTRMSVRVIAVMSLLCSTSFAASLPGQDINARASVIYCTQSEISASARVNFTDSTNAAVKSASQPSTTIVEATVAPVSAGPATAFVAPDSNAPLYFTSTTSLYNGPTMVGKQVKLAGRLFLINGAAFIDDGGSVATPDGSMVPCSVPVRTDLISSLPVDGSLVTIKGIVRTESDGQPTLLPLADSSIVRMQ